MERGTGVRARIGRPQAGKTGTAQQIDPECRCYSQSKYWITLAGMVPADDPRFVVGLKLDAPSGSRESTSAAPLFNTIAGSLTQRYQIPLSKEQAPVQTLQVQ